MRLVRSLWLGIASAASWESPDGVTYGNDVAACTYETGSDYPFGDIKMVTTTSADACCALCVAQAGCIRWVWTASDPTGGGSQHCWLKKSVGAPALGHPDRISGPNPNLTPTPAPQPTPPPTPPQAQPWSKKYRGWTYYTGGNYSGFVVPPQPTFANGTTIANGQLVDCALAWQVDPADAAAEATAPAYRMFYTTFDGTGYRTAMAESLNLVDWSFAPGVVFDRGTSPTSYDYGGVTFGCPLYQNYSVTSPRLLKRTGGKYHVLYGAYPSRTGYEQGDGGEGVASSTDGAIWSRVSDTIPVLTGGKSAAAAKWESKVVYQPNLVEHNGTM